MSTVFLKKNSDRKIDRKDKNEYIEIG